MAGTPQEIQLSVTPAMAACAAYQHGDVVGEYDPSRQSVTVPKSLARTDIVCSAPGYKDKRVSIAPERAGSYGFLLIDYGSTDSSTYPSSLQIIMEPADRQQLPT